MMKLTEEELAALAALDTPTVCNALEIVEPERRGFGYTRRSSARSRRSPYCRIRSNARIRSKHRLSVMLLR